MQNSSKEDIVRAGLKLALAGALLFAARPSIAAAKGFSGSEIAGVDHAVEATLAEYGGKTPVPGAVVGIWDPDRGATYTKAYGAGQLSPNTAMRLDDKFRIGSNTKTFVVTVLLQLVDEGKLRLDDTLDQFALPVKVPNGAHITLRQLCEMRSGLLDLYQQPKFQAANIDPHQPFDIVPWMKSALAHRPLFPPGAQYNYSNTNYILLGWVIEAVTHESVAREIEQRILKPLHLANTSYPVTDPDLPTPFAHGYMLNAKGGWDDETVALPPQLSGPAGVMISDLADLRRWVKAYVSGSVNSAAMQKQRLACLPTPKPNASFGLGIGCSAGWFGYTGGITGYNTAAYYLPAKGATIVVLVNSQRQPEGKWDVASEIVHNIAKVLYPGHVPF
ncbi:MAG: serine hydrolase domain-containing protein [Acetobacteraceae bacterium]